MSSLWVRLGELISNIASEALNAVGFSVVVERVRTLFSGDVQTRRQVAFSVAMIALSAKMAKADGVVSDAEVKAFYQIFAVPKHEIRNVERLYNIAKQDIAGFDIYAKRLYRLCQESCQDEHYQQQECQNKLLEDVIEGLFHIAKSDDVLHQNELDFLSQIAKIFQFSDARFAAISARHVANGEADPWRILGLQKSASLMEAKKRYRQLVRENHPDQVMARGLPEEFLAIAHERLASINNAWALLRKEFVTA